MHSKGWLKRQLEKLDRLNGKEDDQERDVGLGFTAGVVVGLFLGTLGASGIIRDLAARCSNG